MQRLQQPGLSFDFSDLSALESFSQWRKSSSCLRISRPFLSHPICSDHPQPSIQILVAGGADAGLTFGIATAAALFLLRRHDRLCQIIAVLPAKDAADLAVLPEETLAAGVRLVSIIPGAANQNDLVLRFLAHIDILLC